MTAKKVLVISLIFSLIIVIALAFLYLNNRLGGWATNIKPGGASQDKPLTPAELLEQKINKIMEDARQNPAQNPPDKVRQDVINLINAEIIKQEQNKTPEQKAADLKAQEERQKIIDQINNQIKQGLKNNKESGRK